MSNNMMADVTTPVTTASFRKEVAGWLKEEGATKDQALQLLDALYAGVIEGRKSNYRAASGWLDVKESNEPLAIEADGRLVVTDLDVIEVAEPCYCLVGTFEQINTEHKREEDLGVHSANTYFLATKIPYGATPTSSRWAKAAADGIADYVARKSR